MNATFQSLLSGLERRFGRHRGIRNLMMLIVIAMGAVYVFDYILGSVLGIRLANYLVFDRRLVMQGQVWRLLTFMIVPPGGGLLFVAMELLFVYFAGNMLQNRWGTLRLNLFYLTGMLGTLIAGFFTNYASSYYINMSLLLVVAILYPDLQVNLYGVLPIRMKWLALLEVLLLLPGILSGSWGTRIAIIVSLINVLLYLSGELMQRIQTIKRRRAWKRNWRGSPWR